MPLGDCILFFFRWTFVPQAIKVGESVLLGAVTDPVVARRAEGRAREDAKLVKQSDS